MYQINGSTDPAVWGSVPTSSNATWNAVQIVTGANGYRLPTEAQWEYACRAGTNTPWYFGGTASELVNYAWYNTNPGTGRTRQVGLLLPNAWELYDMIGNVREWCWDWGENALRYDDAGGSNDPLGLTSGTLRVTRGGSWYTLSIRSLRSAYREFLNPSNRDPENGLRLVR